MTRDRALLWCSRGRCRRWRSRSSCVRWRSLITSPRLRVYGPDRPVEFPDERYQSTLANDVQVRLGRRRPLKYSASASPSAVAGGSPYRYSVAIAPQSAPARS